MKKFEIGDWFWIKGHDGGSIELSFDKFPLKLQVVYYLYDGWYLMSDNLEWNLDYLDRNNLLEKFDSEQN